MLLITILTIFNQKFYLFWFKIFFNSLLIFSVFLSLIQYRIFEDLRSVCTFSLSSINFFRSSLDNWGTSSTIFSFILLTSSSIIGIEICSFPVINLLRKISFCNFSGRMWSFGTSGTRPHQSDSHYYFHSHYYCNSGSSLYLQCNRHRSWWEYPDFFSDY